MRVFDLKTGATLCAVALFCMTALAGGAGAAEFTETRTISGKSLTLTHLIGEVNVSGHSGSGFEVVVEVRGSDATRDNTRVESGSRTLDVVFPSSKRFVYPGLSSEREIQFQENSDDSWLGALLGRSKIKVSRDGSGMEVWADVEIRVPDGGRLMLRHGAGKIVAENVDGDLDLDSHWGKVAVESVDGDLVVDTGSGDVSVRDARGDLSVDTGSGDVDVAGFQGEEISVDTGSGDVTLADVATAGDVDIDTGSGDVSLTDVSGDKFNIDTGSGDVDASGVRAEGASIDTGSGGVAFLMVEMGGGSFDIDTGSGGITLGIPAGAGCRVAAEAGSGGVQVDMPGVERMRRSDDDDEVSFTVGGGGARVSLDTGSGKIRIRESN